MKKQHINNAAAAVLSVAFAILLGWFCYMSQPADRQDPQPILDIDDSTQYSDVSVKDEDCFEQFYQANREVIDAQFNALARKESRFNALAYNSKEDAVSLLQMRKIYVDEVNRILEIVLPGSEPFDYDDRWDPALQHRMFEIVTAYHNPGLDIDTAIDIHNRRCSDSYRSDVKKYFNEYMKEVQA